MKLLTTAIAIAALPGMLTAQVNKAVQGSATSNYTSNGTCPADKLQVSTFTASPASVSTGQNVTLKFTVKNSCNGSVSLSVPYEVMRGTTKVASGTTTVAAGATNTVQVNWSATEGQHVFVVYTDPAGALNESSANAVNNIAEVAVNVTVPRVTMIMHPDMAPASAGLAPKIRIASHECGPAAKLAELLGNMVLDYTRAPAPPAPFVPIPYPVEIRFAAAVLCKVQTEVEVYAVSLKNGWKVKSVDAQSSGSGGSWTWVSRPSAGSTNPTTKLLVTTPIGTPTLKIKLNVEIEGPQGTNPFQ